MSLCNSVPENSQNIRVKEYLQEEQQQDKKEQTEKLKRKYNS